MTMKKIKRLMARFDQMAHHPMQTLEYSRLWLLWDYSWAFLWHRCSISDYFLYQFYHLNGRGRREFVTLYQLRDIHRLNPPSIFADFEEKDRFLAHFDAFAHRDWVGRVVRNSREEFERFAEKNPTCVIKPRTECGGEGVVLATLTPENIKETYDHMVKNDLIAEGLLTQCAEMARLHPQSVNTVRITTIKGLIVSASVRIGTGGSFMDNGGRGGIFVDADIETGIINTYGANGTAHRFLTHPTTGVILPGFQIPQWDKVQKTIADAIQVIPNTVIVGWDVAITDDGPALIEGNGYPGVYILQGAGPTGLRRTWMAALK